MNIVYTTFGSLGDLHPYLALAQEMKRRGHSPAIATSPHQQTAIEGAGIEFRPVRPDLMQIYSDNNDLFRRACDARQGAKALIRDVFMESLHESFEDLLTAVGGAELLVTHPITFAGPAVAAYRNLPWVSTVLAPISIMSSDDPSILPTPAGPIDPRRIPRPLRRIALGLGRAITHAWTKPLRSLRRDLGVSSVSDPLFNGQHAPDLSLALFSSVFAQPHNDWPPQVRTTGFPYFEHEPQLAPELQEFLDSGPPPLVFTLGTAMVFDAGDFYDQSVEVARRLGKRAVFLLGKDTENTLSTLPPGMMACEYAAFAALFPKALAVIHQGGIGTTAEALRAGCPMLVVPFAHDQPDNAARVERLGVARSLPRRSYNADRAASLLQELLADPDAKVKAADIASRIQQETGVRTACDAIEEYARLT
jgi:UDP:flavonoid glycosyltransferase YjiC (YdhE family)